MSNFQAFAATGDENENSPQKVTVCFKLDPGITVDFKGETITAGSEDKTVQVNTGRNYTFKVTASAVDKKAYIVDGVKYMFASPKTELPSAAEKTQTSDTQQTEKTSDEQISQAVSESNGAEEQSSQQEETPNAGLGGADESEQASIAASSSNDEEENTPSAETSEVAGEQKNAPASDETIENDETPMASPALQSERELSEAQDIVSNGNGSYTLTEEAIKEAADSDRDVVIELTAKEIGEEIIVNNGEGLRKVLESEGDVKVVLDDAIENKTIEVTEAITVKGNKVLELNGITLDVKLSGESENFLTVSQGARLEITDEASKNIVPEGIAHKATTSNDNNAREIEQLAKLGSYDADSKMLTYSVSKSKTNSSTGTTKEYRDTYEVKLSAAGAITSTEINALVKVEAGATLLWKAAASLTLVVSMA